MTAITPLLAARESPVILLVDDNPDDREIYIRALKKIDGVGYRYAEAAGGESMLAYLAEENPDCVLLDYSLPGRNGLELLAQIVTDHPFLPIVMMTGQGNENIAVQAIKAGAQHYLVKSDVTPDLLHETISAAIKHRALEYEHTLLIERLTASNTELERFAYVASHDLQEPVRMVATFSQILADDHAAQLDETGRQYLDIVRQSSMRMRGMIEDLLTYARAGNAVTEIRPFDGQAAFGAALDNLRELIKERSVEITADPLPSLSGNPVQISRLWQNLLANAIKYQAEGAIPRIHVSIVETAEAWRLSVRDNGIGIEARFIEQIFQPFRRLHVWDTIQGTGLGLSICRRIVENHGGQIWAESTPGQGTTFHFTLAKPPVTG
jgi:signal transduction histidine kinase